MPKSLLTKPLSRRTLLRQAAATGVGLAGGALLPPALAYAADDHPPIGTWPAGSTGSSVFVGIGVPRTGTYAPRFVRLNFIGRLRTPNSHYRIEILG